MADIRDGKPTVSEFQKKCDFGDLRQYLTQFKAPDKFWGLEWVGDDAHTFQQYPSLIDNPAFFSEAETIKALVADEMPLKSLVPLLESSFYPCTGEKDEKADSKMTKSWAEYLRYVEPIFVTNGEKLWNSVVSIAEEDSHPILSSLCENQMVAPYPYHWALKDCISKRTLEEVKFYLLLLRNMNLC